MPKVFLSVPTDREEERVKRQRDADTAELLRLWREDEEEAERRQGRYDYDREIMRSRE